MSHILTALSSATQQVNIYELFTWSDINLQEEINFESWGPQQLIGYLSAIATHTEEVDVCTEYRNIVSVKFWTDIITVNG